MIEQTLTDCSFWHRLLSEFLFSIKSFIIRGSMCGQRFEDPFFPRGLLSARKQKKKKKHANNYRASVTRIKNIEKMAELWQVKNQRKTFQGREEYEPKRRDGQE